MSSFINKMIMGILFIGIMMIQTVSAGEDTKIAEVDIGKYGPLISVSEIAGPSRAMGVCVRGNDLYVVGENQLFIYDISAPLKPKLLGKIGGLGNVRQIVVRGTVAYVAAREFGLWLINIADPANPQVISRFATIELATGVEVAGTIAFVAQRHYGVELIDVSDPAKPHHLVLHKTNEAQSAVYDHGKLFVGNWAGSEMTILDVTNPRQPSEISITKLSGYGDGLAVGGNYCYAATGHHARLGKPEEKKNNGHGLDVIDITNLKSPKITGSIRFPAFFGRGMDFWTVRLSGQTAVVADSHNGVFLLNVSDPKHPVAVGQIRLPEPLKRSDNRPDAASSIAIGDGVVYVTGARSGLFVAQVPYLTKPVLQDESTPLPVLGPDLADISVSGFIQYDAKENVRAVAVNGDTAYIAASSGGLHVVRLTENKIDPLAVNPIPFVYDVKYSEGKIYLAEGVDGIGVYSVGADSQLIPIGHCKLPRNNFAQLLWVPKGSHYAIVSSRAGALYFIDVSNPSKMSLVLKHQQRGILYCDLLCDEILDGRYIANNWHSGGLAWYDISGSKPVTANLIEQRLNSYSDGLCVLNGQLLMVNRGKYVLLNPNQPGPTNDWKRHWAGELLFGVPTVNGNMIAFSDSIKKTVRIYDFSVATSAKPIPSRRWNFDYLPGTVSFWQDQLVIPLGYRGLLLEKQ